MNLPGAVTLWGTLALLLALNLPVAVALGLSALIAIAAFDLVSLQVIPELMYSATNSWTLLAIPFFILAGNILARTGIALRLIRLADTLMGRIPGGLGITAVIASIFFAGISGSGPADVAALGTLLIPAMRRSGYDRGFAAALMAAGGGIGIIIPPSIALIVYGVVAEASVAKLFMAGVLPGILVGGALMAVTYGTAARAGTKAPASAAPPAVGRAFRDALWGLLAPVIILGGIYGGIFTPTEAAAVAIVYALIIGIFVHRELRLGDLYTIFSESAIVSASVMLIVVCASVFSWVVTTEGIAQGVAEGLLSLSENRFFLLLIINVVVIALGMFIDAISMFYLLVPIFLPVIERIGVDPVHFGIILTVNLAIGQITPPVGVNLIVASGIAGCSVGRVARAALPLIAAEALVLLLITYLPGLSLWLPRLMN